MIIEIQYKGKTVAVTVTKAERITSDYLVTLAKRYNAGQCSTFNSTP